MQPELFDPYRKWLGIAPKDQPPNLYRLLGIDRFESDPDVIANACDQRMIHVRTFQTGPHAAVSQRILNELSAAKIRLLDPQKRADYERELKEQLNGDGSTSAAAPVERPSLTSPSADGKPPVGGSAARQDAPEAKSPPPRPASQSGILAARGGTDAAATDSKRTADAPTASASSSSSISRSGQGLPDRPRASGPPPKRGKGSAAAVAPLAKDSAAATVVGASASAEDELAGAVFDRPAARRGIPPRPSAARAQQAVRPDKRSTQRWLAVGGLCAAGAVFAAVATFWLFRHDQTPSPVADNTKITDTAAREADGHQAATSAKNSTTNQTATSPSTPVAPATPTGSTAPISPPSAAVASAPQLAVPQQQTVMQGIPLTCQLTTTGPPRGSDYRFELDQPPLGASIDADTGQVHWEPGAELAPGDYKLSVQLVRRDDHAVVSRQPLAVHLLPGLGETDGRGLRAEMFADSELTQLRGARIDRRLDACWLDAAPLSELSPERFSVRWTGWIKALQSGDYTLFLRGSGGGAALWLDDRQLFSIAPRQGAWNLQKSVVLGKKPHSLRIEYRHRAGSAVVGLQWVRPDGVEEIVPAGALFHQFDVAREAPAPAALAGGPDERLDPVSQLPVEEASANPADSKLQADFFRGEGLMQKVGSSSRGIANLWGTRRSFLPGSKAIRWTGTLTPPVAGVYQFIVVHDNLLRVWIGDRLLIDAWKNRGITRDTAETRLEGPQPIRIEYGSTGNQVAALSFRWRTPQSDQDDLIPARVLSHASSQPVARQPAIGSEPVPKPSDVAAAVAALKGEFAADYAPTDQDARLALAKKFRLSASGAEVPPVRRFALLSEARDLAAAQGDLSAAWQAIDLLQRFFAVDPVDMRAQALEIASTAVHDLEGYRAVAESYLSVLQLAYRSGRFLQGVELNTPAKKAAGRCQDRDLRKEVNDMCKQLREISKEEEAMQQARDKLGVDPQDGAANFVVGRFLCLFQENWQAGLPLLSRGENQAYRTAAAADLRHPTEAATRKTVGDLWWEVQKSETDLARARVLLRAQQWYQRSGKGLTSSDAKVVSSRLEEIQRQLASSSAGDVEAVPNSREAASAPHVKAEPLDPTTTRKFVQILLGSHGQVQIEEQNGWIQSVEKLPQGDLTVTGLKLENSSVDDVTMATLGRILTLKSLSIESRKFTDGGVYKLQDLVQLRKLELAAPRLSDKALPALEHMTELESLTLHGDQFGGNLASLKSLPNLRRLDLAGDRIMDVTFATLGQMVGLDSLSVSGGRYSSAAGDNLAGLNNLTTLRLRGASAGDGVATRIARLKGLKWVTFEGPIGRVGVAALSKLDLNRLEITSPQFSDADLDSVGRMTKLVRLYLKTRPISDSGLAKLAGLTQLVLLDIQSATGVTDAGLQSLGPLTKLMNVNLTGARFSFESYRKFKDTHNNATLTPQPPPTPQQHNWHNGGPPHFRH